MCVTLSLSLFPPLFLPLSLSVYIYIYLFIFYFYLYIFVYLYIHKFVFVCISPWMFVCKYRLTCKPARFFSSCSMKLELRNLLSEICPINWYTHLLPLFDCAYTVLSSNLSVSKNSMKYIRKLFGLIISPKRHQFFQIFDLPNRRKIRAITILSQKLDIIILHIAIDYKSINC